MKARNFFALMAALILGLLLVLHCTSCYTPKKAEKEVSRALAYYPEQTIGKVRILAPCVTFGSSTTIDSTGYKAGVDSLKKKKEIYDRLINAINQAPPHPQVEDTLCPAMRKELEVCRQEVEYQEQYIINMTDDFNKIMPVVINRTDTVEDLAKVMEKDLELLRVKGEYRIQVEKTNIAESQKNKWRNRTTVFGISLIVLLLLIGGYFFTQIKKI